MFCTVVRNSVTDGGYDLCDYILMYEGDWNDCEE